VPGRARPGGCEGVLSYQAGSFHGGTHTRTGASGSAPPRTVRRAIAVLVDEGVVWTVQGRGTYVGQPPAEE
jgi:hypothetical protein